MIERISPTDVRRRIGDLLDRVALRNDEFIIERKGKAMAALVSVERLEQIRRIARTNALDFMSAQMETGVSARDADKIATEARRGARRES